LLIIFSRYGEVVNLNLIREKDTGKSKGFCFLCYEDQRSTVLAVDNFNGIKILNRTVRVDHVSNYKIPKQGKKTDAETKKLYEEGCAPKPVPVQVPIKGPVKVKKDPDDFRETLVDLVASEIKLPARLPIYTVKQEKKDDDEVTVKSETKDDEDLSEKKEKKSKKDKKKKKNKKRHTSDSDGSDSDSKKKKKKRKDKKRAKDESGSDYSAEDSEDSEKRKRSPSPHSTKKSRR
jgi:RNA-binding motif X-linked protein 2